MPEKVAALFPCPQYQVIQLYHMPIFGTRNDNFGMTFSMADLTPIANF